MKESIMKTVNQNTTAKEAKEDKLKKLRELNESIKAGANDKHDVDKSKFKPLCIKAKELINKFEPDISVVKLEGGVVTLLNKDQVVFTRDNCNWKGMFIYMLGMLQACRINNSLKPLDIKFQEGEVIWLD